MAGLAAVLNKTSPRFDEKKANFNVFSANDIGL
jgi:hypothetical protein